MTQEHKDMLAAMRASQDRHLRGPSPTKIVVFLREVWVVTEWKDGCVYKRGYVGKVMAFMNDYPFRPGCGAALVPITEGARTS